MDHALSQDTLARRRRSSVLRVIGVLCAIALAAWGVNRLVTPSLDEDELRTSDVRRGNIANTISAAGVVIPNNETQVPSPIPSRVAKVHAKPGQQVSAGELLLELDDSTLRLAADNLREQIAQQDNRIEGLSLGMAQKLKQVNSDIELLALDLESAKVRLGRYQRLQKIGATSASDLNAAELQVKRSEIQLRQHRESIHDTRRATQTEVEGARLQRSILQKQLDQQLQLLAQTQVRAPFAGMLTWLLSEEGASVTAGQLVAKVSELHNYRVEATVSDFYARYLSTGQPVRIGYSGQVLPGRVQTILPEIRDGTVTVLITLEQPNHPLLRNKLRVDANIVTAHKSGVLLVDAGPGLKGTGRQDAFVIRDGVARKTVVDVGLSDGNSMEIRNGAGLGDRVIVSDVSRLKHLDSIRVAN